MCLYTQHDVSIYPTYDRSISMNSIERKQNLKKIKATSKNIYLYNKQLYIYKKFVQDHVLHIHLDKYKLYQTENYLIPQITLFQFLFSCYFVSFKFNHTDSITSLTYNVHLNETSFYRFNEFNIVRILSLKSQYTGR